MHKQVSLMIYTQHACMITIIHVYLCHCYLSYTKYKSIGVHLSHPFTSLDRSLTTDNIVLATKDIPLWKKADSYVYLDIPESQHEEIAAKYDGEQAKRELVSTWLVGHPCPSWDHVVELVKKLEWGIGKSGLGDAIEEKYLRSELFK